jgi:ABC-type antimicrobial peptide transport system permease subunit
MSPSLYLLGAVFALLVASLSAIIPVLRLMRLDVAAALTRRS